MKMLVFLVVDIRFTLNLQNNFSVLITEIPGDGLDGGEAFS